MKRIIAVLIVLIMVLLSICGCSRADTEDSEESSEPGVFTTDGCHLKAEKWVRIPAADITYTETDNNATPFYGVGLSYLVQEDTLPLTECDFGSMMTIDFNLHYEHPQYPQEALCVIAEPVTDIENYRSRIIFVYRLAEDYGFPESLTAGDLDIPDSFNAIDTLEEVTIDLSQFEPISCGDTLQLTERILLPCDINSFSELYCDKVRNMYRNAVESLKEQGVIPQTEDIGALKFNGHEPEFLDEAKGKELTSPWKADQPGAVIADQYFEVYANQAWTIDEQKRASDYPLFFPVTTWWENKTEDWEKGAEPWLKNANSFASSYDEWKYLIIYRDMVSGVEKGYYMGGIDRTTVTTMVFVIDVQTGELVHIKAVASDTPPSYGAEHSVGSIQKDEAFAYINTLLS